VAKHSPEPWRIDEDADVNVMGAVISIGILDSNGDRIGEADARDLDDHTVVEANARLMVAAPKLLVALTALRPLFECGAAEEYAEEIEAAEAAITEAEGEVVQG